MTKCLAACLAALLSFFVPALALAGGYVETPVLEADVKAGKLPPIEQRLPVNPRVVDLAAMGKEPGRPGGAIRMLMGGQNDIRMMTLYGYSRFVAYTEKLEMIPDILESYDVQEGRIFTLKLREGHRWSDGHPFTSEDIRYTFEDVMSDEELSPAGLDREMMIDGKGPKFEVVDERTVRFTWESANPDFLPSLAAARPIFLAMPAHYLKAFHKKYQTPEKLAELVKAEKVKDWTRLHTRMARQYRPENPDLPTLDPWQNTVPTPSERFVFKRNPYFHRVDAQGRQLPYVDQMILTIGTENLIPAKTAAGDSDLQARYLNFADYTILKEAENRVKLKTRLWNAGGGSAVALLPNLNVNDPGWRKVLRDTRVRRALSLGVNREEINQIVYLGLAKESADTVIEESPLYKDEYRTAWSTYDPDKANALLDEAGLDKRASDGIRLLPDGRRADVIVESSGEGNLETDVLQLISDHWKEIGIKLFIRASQRDVLRSRVVAGDTMMSVWNGLDNAVCTADMDPMEFAPTNQAQLQWPQWGLYYESNGSSGQKPDYAPAVALLDLLKTWRAATTKEERVEAWHKILALRSEEVLTIGTVNGTKQPVVSSAKLHNVPEEAVYGFEPGGFFGLYMPDTFWYAE
ncbi:MAG: ABC transporter substrate-binding protein [Parvibaculaceae bacterium]